MSLFALACVAVAGLVLLIFFIYRLVAPSIGWRCEYSAFVPQHVADIPKVGRYAICVSHDRLAFITGRQASPNWDWLPNADFDVVRLETNESIPYIKTVGMRMAGFSRYSQTVGFFRVPVPGRYLVTNLFTYRFVESDEIRIRKHQSFARTALCILGIVGSAFMLIGGSALAAILILTQGF